MLMKETEDNSNRWKDIPCSWIGRLSVVKVTILSTAIYRINAIPVKIPKTFFTELEQRGLKFIWKHKRPQIAKTILRKKNRTGGITSTDFRLYYKAAVTTMALEQKQTQINETRQKAPKETHTPTVNQQQGSHTEEEQFFNTWCWEHWTATDKRTKSEHASNHMQNKLKMD